MSAVGTRRIIWANGEDDFCIAKIGSMLELQDKCDAGIAKIFSRLADGSWGVNDVRETIRIGLIGGGMSPEKAMRAINLHVHGNIGGLAPSVLIAMLVLEAAIVGVRDDPVGKQEAEEAQDPESSLMTDASAAQESTESGQPSSGIPASSMSSPSGNYAPPLTDTTPSMAESQPPSQ